MMAGGRGSRMGNPEKVLARVCGVPLLAQVLSALQESGVCERIVVVTTPMHGKVVRVAQALGAEVLLLPGESYVEDLRAALDVTGVPALVVSGDIAGLTGRRIEWFLEEAMAREEPVVDLVVDGEPVGVTLHKHPRGGEWVQVEAGDPGVIDVDTPGDLMRARSRCT